MINELDEMCKVLEDQAERQETLVAVCLAQLQAGFDGNIRYFSEKTFAMEYIVRETARAEFLRIELMKKICKHFNIEPPCERLREFAEQLPDPWKSRILESCERIKVSILYLKAWVGEALPFYRVSLESAKHAVKTICPDYGEQEPVLYGESSTKKTDVSITRFVNDVG